MSETVSQGRKTRPRRFLVLVPLVLFAALTALFLVRLKAGDPSLIPSALIGHPVPQTALPPIAGLKRDGAAAPGVGPASLQRAVPLVQFWAHCWGRLHHAVEMF